MRTDFVLDALEQALYDRQPERTDGLIHHSDRGSQYVSTLLAMQQDEIGRRTAVELGSAHFFPPSSGEIARSAADFVQQVTSQYEPLQIEMASRVARDKVSELGTLNRRREEFHGKNVLQAFYKAHLHGTGLPKVVFSFETARHAKRRRAVLTFFDDFFASLIRAENQPKETTNKSA